MLPCITETSIGARLVVTLAGDFDLVTRQALTAVCQSAERHGRDTHVQVDLSAVDFIDCGSLRALAALLHNRRAVGDPATLVVASPFLRRVLTAGGFVEPGLIVERLDEAA